MAYCPICFNEFGPNERCPEHGGLVTVLHADDKTTSGELVVIARSWNEFMAHSFEEILRNNAIDAFVKVAGAGFSFGAPLALGYEAYIVVPKALAERARAILEGFEEPGVLRLVESSRS